MKKTFYYLSAFAFMFFSLTASACSGDDDPANEPPKEENPQEGEDEGGGNGEIDYSKVGLEYDDGENLIFHVKLVDIPGYEKPAN